MIRLPRLAAPGIRVLAYFVIAQFTVQPALSQAAAPPAQTHGVTRGVAKYLGCYADRQVRDLSGATFQTSHLITANCEAICREKGFLYAGTQYGSQCFCGNSYGQYGSLPESSCNADCSGNPQVKCGGTWANSVYSLTGQLPPFSQRAVFFFRGIFPELFAFLPYVLTVALAVGLLFSLVGIASGFWLLWEYRLFKKTPQSSIRSIPIGFVHVRGKSVLDNPLTSPLTQTPCCYYRTKIERWVQGGGRNPGQWRKMFQEQSEKEFYLDDGTGRVLVNPKGAEYIMPELYSGEMQAKAAFSQGGLRVLNVDPAFNRDNSPSEAEVHDYLTKHGATNPNISHLISEQCLVAGQEYGVYGTYDKNSDSQSPEDRNKIQKGRKPRTLVITGLTDKKLQGWEGCRAIGWIVGGAIMAAFFLLFLLGFLHVIK